MNIPAQFGISPETRFALGDQEVTPEQGECQTLAAETREEDLSQGMAHTKNFTELL